MSMERFNIIGAGPIGTYLAAELAKKEINKGNEIRLYEEHKEIGKPVQCTGILTEDILKCVSKKTIKEITKTIVRKTTIHSQNEKVTLKINPNYVIDNAKYCQKLAEEAEKKGVKILTQTRYLGNKGNKIEIKDLQKQKTKVIEGKKDKNHLIGADGPNSNVAKQNQMHKKREQLTGIQTIMKVKEYDEKIHFYPHIGTYAWYCPQGDGKARIGIAAKTNAKKIFDDFVKKFEGKKLEMQGGIIPLYQPRQKITKQINKNFKVHLAGDAAPLIKNTTGGGIVPATKIAKIMAENPQNYEKKIGWVKRELYVHYKIHNIMNKFTNKEWNKLIRQVKDEKIKEILRTTNRDQTIKILTKTMIKKPQMMAWGKKLI